MTVAAETSRTAFTLNRIACVAIIPFFLIVIPGCAALEDVADCMWAPDVRGVSTAYCSKASRREREMEARRQAQHAARAEESRKREEQSAIYWAKYNADYPLHHAVRHLDLNRVRGLIAAGISTDARDSNGETPATLCVGGSPDTLDTRVAMLKLLLSKGIDVNAQDDGGYTLLHIAVLAIQQPVMVQLLISRGARINTADHRDRTPLDIALAIVGDDEKALSQLQKTQPNSARISTLQDHVAILKRVAGVLKANGAKRGAELR